MGTQVGQGTLTAGKVYKIKSPSNVIFCAIAYHYRNVDESLATPIYDLVNNVSFDDCAKCELVSPSPSLSATPTPTPSSEAVDWVIVRNGSGDTVGHANKEDLAALASKPLYKAKGCWSITGAKWTGRNWYAHINTGANCYNIKKTGTGTNAWETEASGFEATNDLTNAILNANYYFKVGNARNGGTGTWNHPDCAQDVTDCLPASAVDPIIKIKQTDTYGYDFINDSTTSSTAVSVTAAKATELGSTKFEYTIEITDPGKKAPVNEDVSITLKPDFGGQNNSIDLLKEAKAYGWSQVSSKAFNSTAERTIKIRKPGANDAYEVIEDGNLDITSSSSDNGNDKVTKFKINFMMLRWGDILEWKSDNSANTLNPVSGYQGEIETSITATNGDVQGGSVGVKFYIPLASFFIGIKDENVNTPFHKNLSEYVSVDGKLMCVDPKGNNPCRVQYQTESFTLRIINIGGVGGSITKTWDPATHEPEDGGSTYTTGIPTWWAFDVGMPNSADIGFYETSSEFVVIIDISNDNVSNPPIEGEVLYAGVYQRVITFNGTNEGGANNKFTCKLNVPNTQVNIDS